MKTIINCQTGEILEREFTKEELAQQKIDKIEGEGAMAKEEAKATAKAELLAKLGITEAEAKLLLG
jgi:DNA-binding Xre family transcriptional regulator